MEFRKNDCFSVVIEDMGNDGEGIGKVDGFTVFVKDGIVGDHLLIKLTKIKKNYAYARIEKVEIPSPFRTIPRCPIHKQCGGCQIQALDYMEQLEFKQRKVINHLVRIGGFEQDRIERSMDSIIGMEEPYRYRNKAQYPVGRDKDGNIITGFYAGRTHVIIPVEDCMIGSEKNAKILNIVKKYMQENCVTPYDELTHKGEIRHILIRIGQDTDEIMVSLVINGKKLPKEEMLIQLLREIKGMTSISISSNTEKTNVIMGKEIRLLWGSEFITDRIGSVIFRISPLSFFQVNSIQTEKLYGTALEYADLQGGETVWDLYCGIGTISLFMAQKAAKVYGVEIVPEAIRDARENAKLNHMDNVTFFVGKAEEILPEKYESEKIYADVIVVDRPRKGCDQACLETILKMMPEKVVYVSCDSSTLARDLKILCENAYEIKKIRAVDQFCHTTHVETVCLLSKLHEAKHHVSVKLDMDELDLTASESKATYEEIKKYVAEHYDGMKVTNLYIAQVMRKCGIELAENFNLPKWEGAKGLGDLCSERTGVGTKTAKQPQCPKEKEDAIVEALKHFKMI